MRGRLKLNTARNGLAAPVFFAALLAASHAAAFADGATAAGTSPEMCQNVIVKIHATHWVWLKETRKVHGHRVYVRRHGKIVTVHVRVSYLKFEPERLCTVTPLAALTPPSPVTPSPAAPAPLSSTPVEVGSPPQRPLDSVPPSVGGSAKSGQTLTAEPGSWTGSPTGYLYQWERCDASGASCSGLSGMTSTSYVLGESDVGTTLRVSVIAFNGGGESALATSTQSAVVTAAHPPVSSGPPSIGGTAALGQALNAAPGTWSGAPDEYTYKWQRCNSTGGGCAAISGATSSSYVAGEADLGATLRVAVVATNTAGESPAAGSTQTAVITQPYSTTVGMTTVGPHEDHFGANRKRVNSFTMPTAGLVSKLNIYLQPSGVLEGQQSLEGVLYSDEAGRPGKLLGVSSERVYRTSEPGGWYDLAFPTALNLAAGKYWIGVITGATSEVAGYRFEAAAEGTRYSNENLYTSGPSNPFGTPTSEYQRMSLYATYASEAKSSTPAVNGEPPSISGVAESGQHLSASPGSWSESPTYVYEWQRCSSTGGSCSAIPGATASTYELASADVGKTVKLWVKANGAGGTSALASSALTPVVTSSSGEHDLEYVLNDGLITVYEIGNGWKPAGTIGLPATAAGIRGVMVSPGTHMMFISYGGDSGADGNGSVLAYNLATDEIAWTVHLETGIDSGAVSPDGKLLYMPSGEKSSSDIWNILNAEDGEVVGKIEGGNAPHNTIASKNGQFVYLGARYSEYLSVYNTSTHAVSKVGKLKLGVRPFTVNGSNTLAFTTATEFDGFQISSITNGNVLDTVEFAPVPKGLPDSGPSHGISLSPDGKELYVVDDVNKAVQAYTAPDVSEIAEGVKPTQRVAIPVAGLTETESPCAYDCTRGGWLQRSTDGKLLFVGDSGAVINTEPGGTPSVVANLPALLNTKISIEVDWKNGEPIATSGRTGVGEE